jgi:hypothetical protein
MDRFCYTRLFSLVLICGTCAKIIREMPKTLEDVADLGSYICALDKG